MKHPGASFHKPFVLISLAVMLLAGICLAIWAAGAFLPGFDREKYGMADYNVTYCTVGAESLKLDVYYPDSGGPWAGLIYIHGGGWSEGDKSGVDTRFTSLGYLVVSLNYRLYPDFRFPAMIADVKCAIRYLRAHARQYHLDPERIALVGHSAGAHLAALAGVADETAGWDSGEYADQSSRVQAVVALAGPYDLSGHFPLWVDELIQNVFGDEQRLPASPISYVSPDDPPFLIIHGDADDVVPVEQAEFFAQALQAAKVSVAVVIVKNGGHGLEPVGAAVTMPAGEEIYARVRLFLQQSWPHSP